MNDYNYSKFVESTPDDELSTLASLIGIQCAAEKAVMKAESELRKAQEVLRNVSEKLVPEKMVELNVTEFKTADGVKVVLTPSLHASIKKENMPEAAGWLDDNGFGSIVKRSISVALGRDQAEKAEAIKEALMREYRLSPKEDVKVEPSTLKKFVRERLEEGAEVPMELFGVYEYKVAKITEGKPKPVFEGE